MSSVHYKFKATLEYKTLTFDGLHIGVDELKKAICDKENIRTESFDLLLTNAHTKREYTTGELVPRNSSVIVQRVPRDNALKLPKVQDTSTSGIVTRNVVGAFQQLQTSYINPEEFAGMTEEQRLAHIKRVSTEKYSSANYQRRTSIMTGPPPATYVCNRCGQPGHWYKSCPLLNVRRTAGITMDELMETDRDDPLAMIHPSGKFVKPIMHHQARLQRKHEPFPGQPDESAAGRSPGQQQAVMAAVPDQFKCRLCGGLLRDAVLSACCGHSFCAECYQQQLLAHPTERCPGPDCAQQISADSLVPNKMLRDAVQKYISIEDRSSLGAADSLLGSLGLTPEQPAGANKPSVLTDTHSLLHKLLPGLANAQAKRELATGVTAAAASGTESPISSHLIGQAAASGTTPIQQPPRVTPTPPPLQQAVLTPTEQRQQSFTPPSATTTSTSPAFPGAVQSALVMPQPANPPVHLPLFDPNKPPPPLSSMLNAFSGSLPQPTTSSAIPPLFPPAATSLSAPAAPTNSAALSAEDSLAAWESFLKRKEDEKAERNLLMRNSSSYQQQQPRSLLFDHTGIGGRERDYGRDGGGGGSQEREHRRAADRDRHHHHYHHSSSSRNSTSSSSRRGRGDHREEAEKQPKLSVEEMNSAWKCFEKRIDEKKAAAAIKLPTSLASAKLAEEGEAKHNGKEEEDEQHKKEEEEEKGKKEEEEQRKEEDVQNKREEEEEKSKNEEEEGERHKRKEEEEDVQEEEVRRHKRKEEAEKVRHKRKEEAERHERKERTERHKRKEEKGKKEEDERHKWREESERHKRKQEAEDVRHKRKQEAEDVRHKRRKEEEDEDVRHKPKEEAEEILRKHKRRKEEEEKVKKEEEEEKAEKHKRKEEEEGKKEGEEREKAKKEEEKEEEETERKKKRKKEKEEDEKKKDQKKEEEEKRKKEKEGEEKGGRVGRRRSSSSRRKSSRDEEEKEEKKERDNSRKASMGDIGSKKETPLSPSSTALNQLDLALAQQAADRWQVGRLRHAPTRPPPNFDDTARWRPPIPEVREQEMLRKTESPPAAPVVVGDELFINMTAAPSASGKEKTTATTSTTKAAAESADLIMRRRSSTSSTTATLVVGQQQQLAKPTIESSMPPPLNGGEKEDKKERRKRKKEKKEKKKKEKKEKKEKKRKREHSSSKEKEEDKEKQHKRHHHHRVRHS